MSRAVVSSAASRAAAPPPLVVMYTTRERARTLLRAAFPRRRARLVLTRTPDELDATFRSALVDAAVVDLASPGDDTWRAAALAREFPSVPFFGLSALRASEAPALAQCAALDFADVIVESVDDAVCRELVLRHAFSSRFALALDEPPAALELDTPLQLGAWRCIVAWAGRPVRTQLLADVLGVTREHLSRTFAADGERDVLTFKSVGTSVQDLALAGALCSAAEERGVGRELGELTRLKPFASVAKTR